MTENYRKQLKFYLGDYETHIDIDKRIVPSAKSHCHKRFEVHISTGGITEVTIENVDSYLVHEGQMYIIGCNVLHREEVKVKSEKPEFCIGISFFAKNEEAEPEGKEIVDSFADVFFWHGNYSCEIMEILEKFDLEIENRQIGHKIKRINLMSELIIEVLRHFNLKKEETNSSVSELEKDVFRGIDLYFSEIISGEREHADKEEVKEKFGMNEKQLQKFFARYYGCTFKEKEMVSKIQRAKELLLTTSDPIEKISARCNYCDVKYFFKQFKKHVGITPNQYRSYKLNKK